MTVLTPKTGVIDVSTRGVPSLLRSTTSTAVGTVIAIIGTTCVVTAAARLDRNWPIAVAFAGAGGSLACAALVDAAHERLPNRFLLIALGMLVLAPVVARQPGALLVVALGLVLGGAPLLAVLLARGIGIGDVKFAAVLGAAAALVHPLAALGTVFLAALASASYAAARDLRRLPLGPWLWSGFAISTLAASLAPLANEHLGSTNWGL